MAIGLHILKSGICPRMISWFIGVWNWAQINVDTKEDKDSPGHCLLTERGMERVLACTTADKHERPDLKPGIHYRVREHPRPEENWLPLPDTKFTAEYRHTWVFVRNHRPKDATFMHCPLPRRGVAQQERNAAITMTYFRAFTLDPDRGDEYVHFLGDLCKGHTTWHGAMTSFFSKGVLCEESRRYISNFLVVTRARPDMEAGGEQNSDDLASDEELYLDKNTFDKALETTVGTGRQRAEDTDLTTGKKTECDKHAVSEEHAASARVAFQLAQERWTSQVLITEATCTEGLGTTEECLEEMRKAARASQRKEHGGGPRKAEPREATLREGSRYSAQDIRDWIADVRGRKNQHGAPMYRQAQIAAVEKVTDRMCKELEQQAAEMDVEDPISLVSPGWSRHG